MRFQVLVDGRPRPVELAFGNAHDLRTISHWRVPSTALSLAPVRDTVEFARLASKRHRHYLRSIRTATGLDEFRAIIRESAEAEVAFLLLARADWFLRSPVVGLAQCRRTYCHHIVLEFLSVHPAIVGRIKPNVSGVGKGLVYALAELAGQVRAKLIWGEATGSSASFYSHVLEVPGVEDRFYIRGETMERCRHQFREKFLGVLA